MLGIEAGIHEQLDLTSAQKRERVLGALLKQIETVARAAPTLLIVEDAHWIDPTTEKLVDRIAACLAELRAELLMICRPGYHAPLKQRAAAGFVQAEGKPRASRRTPSNV